MAITITPNIQPASASSAPTAGILLQPGQVVTAQVLQVLGTDEVQIAIGGQTIEATTQVPLQVGQSLHQFVSIPGDHSRDNPLSKPLEETPITAEVSAIEKRNIEFQVIAMKFAAII